MNILRNWESTPAYDGQGERMTPGGHLCKIMDAEVKTSMSGREQMVLYLEVIDEGELNGFYARQYKRRKESKRDVTWPCRFFQGTQDINGNASPYFKGLIKAIEESNAGYKWNWQERGLKGLRVGFIFREEEYQDSMGEIKTAVKPAFCASTQRIREGVEVTAKKVLEGQMTALPAQSGFTPVDDDELPF